MGGSLLGTKGWFSLPCRFIYLQINLNVIICNTDNDKCLTKQKCVSLETGSLRDDWDIITDLKKISLQILHCSHGGLSTQGENTKTKQKKKKFLSDFIQPSFLEASVGLRKCPLCRHAFEAGPRSTSNLIQVSEQVLKSKVTRLLPIYTGLKTMI